MELTDTILQKPFSGFSRLKLFFALSRTPHGLIDMTTPAAAAMLCLGAFPELSVILLGLVTTFSGYTAVYALNDVVDHRNDTAKIQAGGFQDLGSDLDAVLVRHPIAQGFLSFREGVLWAVAWALLAMVGAFLLNPICLLIFLAGAGLEILYCLLWRVSAMRAMVNGVVKTSGAVAAVFAVNPNPPLIFLGTLFFCLFCWEIGGQNVPNDWADIEEDRRFDARTIPVRLGPRASGKIIIVFLLAAWLLCFVLLRVSPAGFGPMGYASVFFGGIYLLILPGLRLYRSGRRNDAMVLFNRASYFPPALALLAGCQLFF
jgi:4-hydroxybenzoate polyprenyltransferase